MKLIKQATEFKEAFELSTGKIIDAGYLSVGADSSDSFICVYKDNQDDSWEREVFWSHSFTDKERMEIAEYMIRLWATWGYDLGGSGGGPHLKIKAPGINIDLTPAEDGHGGPGRLPPPRQRRALT